MRSIMNNLKRHYFFVLFFMYHTRNMKELDEVSEHHQLGSYLANDFTKHS